jgi:Family of unknown function (DUF6518)
VLTGIRDGIRFPRWAPVAAGLLIGAVIGGGTAIVQPWVREPWSALVNSSSPWLLGGFVAGALSARQRKRAAVVAGLAVCLAEVGAYYAVATAGHIPVTHSYVIFWIACALTGGPVSGWAGWAWRRGTGRGSAAGPAFPAGTFIAEGIGAYGLRLHYQPAVVIFVVIGVLLFALVAWRTGQRRVYAWTVVFVVGGALVYGPVLSAVVGLQSGGVYLGP